MTSHRATRQARATLCLALLATVTSACGDCISIAYASLDIAIVDARTGAPTAAGATVLVTGPAFTDSVTFGPDAGNQTMHYRAFESSAAPGAYAVTIRKPGYETWIRTDVRVRDSGDCGHVRTTSLTAALTPVP